MRALVTGGRQYSNPKCVAATLTRLHKVTPISILIHGAAKGADALAATWAQRHHVLTHSYPASWADTSHPDAVIKQDRFGRAYDARAGYRRNQIMLERGRPDLVIAFAGGAGTRDMIRRAKAARIRVLEISA